jgi:hypothetical protein
MVTFAVCDVMRMFAPFPALEAEAALRSLFARPVEARSPVRGRLFSCKDTNALAQAAHDAFYHHAPLVLSPDVVWLCLAQGFARHVNLNAEALRARFVAHQGKVTLTVRRPDMELGRPGPWDEVVAAFSDQLADHLGKTRDLVVADFSTTGPIERVASEVVLMDAFQGYFEYELMFGCGIPEITLSGTPDDWRSIRRRAQTFSEYGLERWIDELLPVLDRLIATAEGRVDVPFWRSFFRYQSGSGPSELTGWILTLFPYLDELSSGARLASGGRETLRKPVWNRYLTGWHARYAAAEARDPKNWRDVRFDGPALAAIPSGLAGAPVRCVDIRTGAETMLRFVGGLTGVLQDETTTALTPEVGWAILR